MSKKNDDRKNIVIVGGGSGGAQAAYTLSKKLDANEYNVILINPRPYSVVWPATLRVAVSNVDNLEERIFLPLHEIFHNGNGTFVQGKVTAIYKDGEKGGRVLLESGEYVEFDALVLSTGNIWTGPVAFPEDAGQVNNFIRNGRIAFEKAQNIVIAGGGAIGIELAGEIKDIWPNKKVTIVHAGSALLNAAYPDKLRSRVERRIQDTGTHVILNDFVDTFEVGPIAKGTGIKTRNGVQVETDLVVSARGPRPNTSFIASSLGSNAVNDSGFVRIHPTLQLRDHPDIFALGDIVDWNEQKQLVKAAAHASIVVSNVEAYFSGHKMKEYKGSPEMIAITVGKNGGVTYIGLLWGIIIGDWFTRWMKSRDLIVDRVRAALGQ
ncbi:hypothetical protein AX15_001383 [Amanita polypyramis BW_CC]|nr:hypothetical protein AX15_001383 [Amanita polypyramis BW_CC]